MAGYEGVARRFASEEESGWEFTASDTLHAGKEVFNFEEDFPLSEFNRFFLSSSAELSPGEYKEAKKRMQFLYDQLAARILKERSPGKNFKGDMSGKLKKVQGHIQLHDIMHAASAAERNHARGVESCIPTFLEPGNLINDERALREELDALLFSITPSFKSLLVVRTHQLEEALFEEVFESFVEKAFEFLRGQMFHDLAEQYSDSIPTDVLEAADREFSQLKEKITNDMDPITVARARRIFDGWRADNRRILVEEFLSMTRSLPVVEEAELKLAA